MLRIAHENSSGTACVLLQNGGAFHYEKDDFSRVRVYEGQLNPTQLSSVVQRVRALSALAQSQIEEPLLPSARDLLDIHIFQNGPIKELLFRSPESQRQHAAEVFPLLRWMNTLPRLLTRELSEDAGKQNCLPRRDLVLRKRNQVSPQPPLTRTPTAGRRIAPPPPAAAQAETQLTPLLYFKLLEKTSSAALHKCVLVASNGRYRFERRTQKLGGKEIENSLSQGQVGKDDLERLRTILDAPSLASVRHHEPPGGMPLNIMGSVLEISISRPSGVQELILTDSKHRTIFFFTGDGDISKAAPLLKFVGEEMESRAASAPATQLNGCSQPSGW